MTKDDFPATVLNAIKLLQGKRAILISEIEQLDRALAALASLQRMHPVEFIPKDTGDLRDSFPAQKKPKPKLVELTTAERREKLVAFLTLRHEPVTPALIRRTIGFDYGTKNLANDLHRLSEAGRAIRSDDGSGWSVPKPKREPKPTAADTHDVVWRPGRDARSLTGSAPGLGSTLAADAVKR